MKNAVFWDVTPCSSYKDPRYIVFLRSVLRLLVTANVPTLLILVTLMMEAIRPSKHWLLQEPHGVTCQKTAYFKGEFLYNLYMYYYCCYYILIITNLIELLLLL
jgi:hypothetical protein